jgi:RNAse (barnase) inhibitor barstar
MSPHRQPPTLAKAVQLGGGTDPLDAVAACAAALDARVLDVDLAGCAGKSALLERLAAKLELPDWFGHNWDALADCLGDLSWLEADRYVLLFRHAGDLRTAAPDDYRMLIEILERSSATWRERGVALVSFIDTGDTPG